MLLPSVLFFFVFCYVPLGGIVIAFKDYQYDLGIFGSPWVGLDNFKFFFTSGKAWILCRNTILYNVAFTATGLFFQVSLAIIISQLGNKIFKKVSHSIIFLPYFISWVIVAAMAYNLLNYNYGVVNHIIRVFGGDPINFYATPGVWPYLLVFFSNWKGIGYGSVVYLATITGIDGSLYEAAMLDGASKWQQTRYITMPMLKTVIVMMFILSVGGIFASDFGLFYQVTQGVPNSLYKVASTFDTYVYAALQGNAPIGKTAAASTFQSVACCITILLTNFFVSKVDSDSAVF